MHLTDTHCHIHSNDYPLSPKEVIATASQKGVDRLICVGTSLEDSLRSVEFVATQTNCWASVGMHPHEASQYDHNKQALDKFENLATMPKVVSIGECGLDYHYNHSPKQQQRQVLEFQLGMAQKYRLPVIFHVREAFDDFFAILDHFNGVRGVIHSFTADNTALDKCLIRGLYIGLNGIMTFTNQQSQLTAAKAVPLDKLLLETDAPYLTPKPHRGDVCQPKHLAVTAEFLSNLRGETIENLAVATTNNASKLFKLPVKDTK